MKLEFARKESELRQRSAQQEAEIFVLSAERDAAVAAIEAAVEGEDVTGDSVKSDGLSLASEDYKKWVEQYLKSCDAGETVNC